MATRPLRSSSIGRPLILAICSTLLATGCDTSERDPGVKNDAMVAPVGTSAPSAAADQTAKNQSHQDPPGIAETSAQPAKPLDLTRGDNLQSLDEATSAAGDEPSNLLPDLFDDKSARTGARVSGRVLMNDVEKISADAVEGVEFKLEVPVN